MPISYFHSSAFHLPSLDDGKNGSVQRALSSPIVCRWERGESRQVPVSSQESPKRLIGALTGNWQLATGNWQLATGSWPTGNSQPIHGRSAILTACSQLLRPGVWVRRSCRRSRSAIGSGLVTEAQPPASKGGVGLVTLDFLALGRDGQPIADLKPEEVSLKIGGRARPLTAVNPIDVTAAAPAAAASLPPPFGSNVGTQESRAIVLVVDDDSFRVGTERAVREAADTFLDNLGPTDCIALVTMPYGGTRVSLTTEQEAVRKSLAGVIGQAPPRETPDDMACRSRRTLDSLRGLFDGFAGSPLPVTVAFVSASMSGPEQVIRQGQRVATCALLPDNFNQVGAAAAAAVRGCTSSSRWASPTRSSDSSISPA